MISEFAFNVFKSKVNALDTSRNVDVPRSQFVLVTNEIILGKIERLKDDSIDSSEVEELDELKVPYRSLKKVDHCENNDEYVSFELPGDFFFRISSVAYAKRGECTVKLTVEIPRPKDLDTVRANENHVPSFDFEHTIGWFTGTTLNVAVDKEFSIEDAQLSYYRLPRLLDIAGYTKTDGESSSNVDCDLSDPLMYKILTAAAEEYFKRTTNVTAVQIAKAGSQP